MARLLITDLYALGGASAPKSAPGIIDTKNNSQCPRPNSFETRNGGTKKMVKTNVDHVDQGRLGGGDCGAPLFPIG